MFQVAGAIGGQGIAAIHEGVYEDAVYAIFFSHAQQRVEMRLIGMHAAVGEQAEQVQAASAGTGIFHGGEQHRMREEFAVLDHELDARAVHVHDASRADVEMPDFAITHLAVRQSDVRAAGVNQSVGIVAQKAVIIRLAGQRDGVGFGFGAISPAVEDDEDERFGTGHFWKSSSSNCDRSMFR